MRDNTVMVHLTLFSTSDVLPHMLEWRVGEQRAIHQHPSKQSALETRSWAIGWVAARTQCFELAVAAAAAATAAATAPRLPAACYSGDRALPPFSLVCCLCVSDERRRAVWGDWGRPLCATRDGWGRPQLPPETPLFSAGKVSPPYSARSLRQARGVCLSTAHPILSPAAYARVIT